MSAEQGPSNQPEQGGWPDLNGMSPEQQQEMLDRILGSEGEGNSLDIFKRDLAAVWDDLSQEERDAILNEFPGLLGGQS